MDPLVKVALLSALFAGSHLLLATAPLRSRLVDRLTEFWFVFVYSVVSWASFGAAALYYYSHRADGPEGLGVAQLPWVQWPAVVLIIVSLCLITGILSPSGYVAGPMALFSGRTPEPQGMERITRHSMFVGAVLFGVGHCLLAAKMVGVVYFGSFAALGFIGSWHQDAKLRSQRGEASRLYLERTSTVPFVAIIAGRQRLVFAELPWLFFGLGVLASWGLYALHGAEFDYTPHVIIAVLVVAPIGLTGWSYTRNRRDRDDRDV